jgi:hypothetical protein
MRNIFTFLTIFLIISINAVCGIYHVKIDGSDDNSGLSWNESFLTVQKALDMAQEGDQIWVAEGIYKPTFDYGLNIGERGKHFRLKPGVGLYGGISADGEPTFEDRAHYKYQTILCGDLNDDDYWNESEMMWENREDNCFHVFYHQKGLNLDSNAILDGFHISNGNANGEGIHSFGGGIHNDSSSPKLRNSVFTWNYALNGGGALYNLSSQPKITDCQFTWNDTDSQVFGGGAIYNANSDLEISNCIFDGNHALVRGGAILNNHSSIKLSECSFIGNLANERGGAVVNDSSSHSTITNCIFSGNESGYGGGIYNLRSSPIIQNCFFYGNIANGILHGGILSFGGGGMANDHAYIKIANCTFVNNISKIDGGGILNLRSTINLRNTILWSNVANNNGNELVFIEGFGYISTSCFSFEPDDVLGNRFGLSNCIHSDPMFVGDLSNYPFALSVNSPCIDYGDNQFIDLPFDIRGSKFPRKLNGHDGTEGIIDIGAYEFNVHQDLVSVRENVSTLLIHPNPAMEYIEITKPSEGFEPSEGSNVKIFNTLGECVMTVETRRAVSLQRLDISHLPTGVYFLRFGSQTQKFVKM